MQFPRHRILIFARAPVPGRCKRRLAPALGREGAARLARNLLAHTLARVEAARLAPAILCCHPHAGHPQFRQWELEKWSQEGSDLGERMWRAAARALETAEGVVIVGSDCPACDAAYLETALKELRRNEVVIGPAEDGGYVLIGLQRAERRLFEEISWGGADVLEKTLRRAERLGLGVKRLATRWDVDRPEDLARLRRSFPAIVSE